MLQTSTRTCKVESRRNLRELPIRNRNEKRGGQQASKLKSHYTPCYVLFDGGTLCMVRHTLSLSPTKPYNITSQAYSFWHQLPHSANSDTQSSPRKAGMLSHITHTWFLSPSHLSPNIAHPLTLHHPPTQAYSSLSHLTLHSHSYIYMKGCVCQSLFEYHIYIYQYILSTKMYTANFCQSR